MAFQFSKYIFNLFPAYFKRDDTNKDINDEGTFERFVAVVEDDLDLEVLPLITKLQNITVAFDPLGEQAPEKLLSHIANVLGNPPDIFSDIDQYRRILAYIVSVYKIKGTKRSYELLFSMLGFDVTVIELPLPNGFYDVGELYDDVLLYDQDCPGCSDYDLLFSNVDDDPLGMPPVINPIDAATLAKLREIAFFNEPINAKLRNLTNAVSVVESQNLCLIQNIVIEIFTTPKYDDVEIYDTGQTYDTVSDPEQLTVTTDCVGNITGITQEGIGVWIIETDFEVQ